MTGRDRVLRTLEFDHPDRVPRDLWMLPIARLEHGTSAIDEFIRRWPADFTQCTIGKPRTLRTQGDPNVVGVYIDEWGCRYENLQAGVHGEVKQPLIGDYARLDDLRPPVELHNIARAAANDFCRTTDCFTIASGWARPFERLQFVRGTENVFMDLAEESHELLELLHRIHTFYRDNFQVWAQTDVDALMIMDDWGSQRSLLISPQQWRKIFKPLYAEYGRIARDHGKKLFMHSDGCIMDIYEDLIEVGVDAINSQLFCMNIEEIGERFRGRITFWGEIDRQHLLPFGSAEEIEAAVQRVADNLRPSTGGGVIAQLELGPKAQLQNAEAAFAAWSQISIARQQT